MTELETAQANLANLLAKIKSQEASLDEMTASSKALDSQGADQEAEKQKLQGEQTLALDRKQEIEKRISVLNSGSPVKDADAQAATFELRPPCLQEPHRPSVLPISVRKVMYCSCIRV